MKAKLCCILVTLLGMVVGLGLCLLLVHWTVGWEDEDWLKQGHLEDVASGVGAVVDSKEEVAKRTKHLIEEEICRAEPYMMRHRELRERASEMIKTFYKNTEDPMPQHVEEWLSRNEEEVLWDRWDQWREEREMSEPDFEL